MKLLTRTIVFCLLLFVADTVVAQSSGPTPPPPPVCSQSNAGALYTNTGTTPATVYTCSYYNLAWNWVVNPSYGGIVYYPTVPSTCSGALPVFLSGWPTTTMYLCVNGISTPLSYNGSPTFAGTVTVPNLINTGIPAGSIVASGGTSPETAATSAQMVTALNASPSSLLSASLMPATVALTNIAKTFTATQTFDRGLLTYGLNAGYIPNPGAPLYTVNSTGGTLTAGTYVIGISALDANSGQTLIGPTVSVTIASGTANSISVSWSGVTNAVAYNIWLVSSDYLMGTVNYPSLSYTITTPVGGIAPIPTSNTTGVVNGVGTFTGTGNTGTLTAGAGITGTANIFKAAQNFSDHYDKGPMVDIRAYGAKCDGVTNDLVAFQAAVAAAISAKAALYIPPGNCLLTYSAPNAQTNITGDLAIIGNATEPSQLTVKPDDPTFDYFTLYQSPGTNLTVQNLTINGPNYSTQNYANPTAYFIYHNGGPGVGSTNLLNDNITGMFYEVIAKAGPSDTATTDNTINIINTTETAYYNANGIFTNGGTAITDGTVTGTDLHSALTTFTSADVGSHVAISGGGPNGSPLKTTIAAIAGPNDATLKQAVFQTIPGSSTVMDAAMQAARTITDGAINAGSSTLTSASAQFVAADVGRRLTIMGAGQGGAPYSGTITAYNSASSVTVRVKALTSVTGATVTIDVDTKLTSATAGFTTADVGRIVTIYGAGPSGGNFVNIIETVVNSTTVYVQQPPSTTVSGAQLNINYAGMSYGIPQLSLNVINSHFTNLAFYGDPAMIAYYFYIHPSVNVLMEGSTFDNAPYYALHLWSSGGVPPYEVADSIRIDNCQFGPNLAYVTGGAIAATDPNSYYHVVISNSTIRSRQNGIYVSGGSIEMNNDDIITPYGSAINAVNPTFYSPARVEVHGGRIGSANGVNVGQPGSTWTFDGVTFESQNTANFQLSNATTQGVNLVVRNSQFHGASAGSISLSYGNNIIQNNLFSGTVTSSALNTAGTGLISAEVSGNTFAETANTTAIASGSIGPQVLRGGNNTFLGSVGPSSVGTAVEGLGNRQGVFPQTTASAASTTLGLPFPGGYAGGMTSWNFDTFHISGTTTINNIYLDTTANTPIFSGAINLIADAAWSLGSSGNIVPCTATALTVGANVRLNYDSLAGKWYQSCGSPVVLSGTTGSIGGSALLVNACASGTATVTGATTGMAIGVTPVADPNAGTSQSYDWYGTVTGTNTVTVYVCAIVAGTPTATTYNVRVIQ